MNEHQNSDAKETRDAAQTGMFVMMAMMMVCCVGIFLLIAIIPFIGWPAGAVLAIAGGAAMMFAHQKFMRHGSHR